MRTGRRCPSDFIAMRYSTLRQNHSHLYRLSVHGSPTCVRCDAPHNLPSTVPIDDKLSAYFGVAAAEQLSIFFHPVSWICTSCFFPTIESHLNVFLVSSAYRSPSLGFKGCVATVGWVSACGMCDLSIPDSRLLERRGFCSLRCDLIAKSNRTEPDEPNFQCAPAAHTMNTCAFISQSSHFETTRKTPSQHYLQNFHCHVQRKSRRQRNVSLQVDCASRVPAGLAYTPQECNPNSGTVAAFSTHPHAS